MEAKGWIRCSVVACVGRLDIGMLLNFSLL